MDDNNYENKVIIMKTMQWKKLTNILLIYNLRYIPLTSIMTVGNKIMWHKYFTVYYGRVYPPPIHVAK